MTTEELMALGLTKEQADSVFALRGKELTDLRTQISTLTEQNTQLQADSQELATLKQQNMTAEQLQQQAIEKANAEKEKYEKMILSVKAKEKLIEGGLLPEEIDEDLVDLMVGSDEADTIKKCESYTSRISAKLKANETKLREELLKGTDEPPKPNGDKGGNISEAEKFAKDIANLGNISLEDAKNAADYYLK